MAGVVALLTLCFGCMTATEILLQPTMTHTLITQMDTRLPQQSAFLFPQEIIVFARACVVVTQRLIGFTAITTT